MHVDKYTPGLCTKPHEFILVFSEWSGNGQAKQYKLSFYYICGDTAHIQYIQMISNIVSNNQEKKQQ